MEGRAWEVAWAFQGLPVDMDGSTHFKRVTQPLIDHSFFVTFELLSWFGMTGKFSVRSESKKLVGRPILIGTSLVYQILSPSIMRSLQTRDKISGGTRRSQWSCRGSQGCFRKFQEARRASVAKRGTTWSHGVFQRVLGFQGDSRRSHLCFIESQGVGAVH